MIIHHGALSDPYEEQYNKFGFTLGKEAEVMQDIGDKIVFLWIQGILTDSEYDKVLARFQKQMSKVVKPIKRKEEP